MINQIHFSSDTVEWYTPQDFFERLNKIYRFTLDPCSDSTNFKCEKHYTKKEDGLLQSWTGEIVFMNPPYGREIGAWVKKAALEKAYTVALLPARVDTKWFHNYIEGKYLYKFIRGRLKFGGSYSSAPFPSMIVLFDNL